MEIKGRDVASISVLVAGKGVNGIGVSVGKRFWGLKRRIWEERCIVRHWCCEVGGTRSLAIECQSGWACIGVFDAQHDGSRWS